MRGKSTDQHSIFSYRSLEDRIPRRHPLRDIRKIADKALSELSPVFDEMYAGVGRPSIPPEQLIRAMLIQVLFSIRSERLLMEELDFNLLYRWFVGLSMDDQVWDHSVFSKNRDRLLLHDVSDRFFDAIKEQAAAKKLLSRDHFTIDFTSESDEVRVPPDGDDVVEVEEDSQTVCTIASWTSGQGEDVEASELSWVMF